MQNLWQHCLTMLESSLGSSQFNIWIKPLKVSMDGDTLVIWVPNQIFLQFIRDRYLSQIESMVETQSHGTTQKVVLRVYVDASPPRTTLCHTEQQQVGSLSSFPTSHPLAAPVPAERFKNAVNHESMKINPFYTFETLVTGKANQLARAAAIQVAEHPGTSYNPLFLYGGVGLGKTHMIQAIGNYVHQNKPQAKIRYIHAEKYVQDVVRAYQHKAFDKFKSYYHSLDLLLIDDIQFLAGNKERTQEEFFYLFNALVESGKQIIITSDRIPRDIEGLQERLKSRFSWGLTAQMEPPELEMRVAILLKKAEMDHFMLDANVAFFIAKSIRSNVRELEGALKRVLAYARFTHQPVTIEAAKEALKDILASSNRQLTVEHIQKTVADFCKIKVADMHSKKRTRDVARPRQIAMALTKELTALSLPAIGDAFGGRDHTTVLHACRTIENLRQTESTVAHEYLVLLDILKH